MQKRAFQGYLKIFMMAEFFLFIASIRDYTDPRHLIQYGGLFVLLLIIYLETGFFLGLVLPGGDYLIFTAGLLCGTQYLDLPLPVLMTMMILAAVLGDFTGYYKGKWLGPKLFSKPDARFFKRSYLDKSRAFYEKYGAIAFVSGRFMPVIRTMIPILAGASGFSLARFSFLNGLGAVIWIGLLTPLGYFLGRRYPQLMDYSIWFLLGILVLASIPTLKIINPFKNK